MHAAAELQVVRHVSLGDFVLRALSNFNTHNLFDAKEAASVKHNEPRVTRWIGYSSAAPAVIAALNEGSAASSSPRRYREAPLKVLTAPPRAPEKTKSAQLHMFTEGREPQWVKVETLRRNSAIAEGGRY